MECYATKLFAKVSVRRAFGEAVGRHVWSGAPSLQLNSHRLPKAGIDESNQDSALGAFAADHGESSLLFVAVLSYVQLAGEQVFPVLRFTTAQPVYFVCLVLGLPELAVESNRRGLVKFACRRAPAHACLEVSMKAGSTVGHCHGDCGINVWFAVKQVHMDR